MMLPSSGDTIKINVISRLTGNLIQPAPVPNRLRYPIRSGMTGSVLSSLGDIIAVKGSREKVQNRPGCLDLAYARKHNITITFFILYFMLNLWQYDQKRLLIYKEIIMVNSNNEAGRSMIEMLGVLAIIGVLSVGGIAGYSKAMMQYKINKTADQVTQIVGNVRTLFGSQRNYNGLSCFSPCSSAALVKKSHLVPDEMWNAAGTSLENPFGGTVDIWAVGKKAAGDNKAFSIALLGLPEEACMALSTYDWGSGSSSGLISIVTNSDEEDPVVGCAGAQNANRAIACPNGATVSVPMPVNVAATVCKTGDNNLVTLKFY